MAQKHFELVQACVQLVNNYEQVKNYAVSKGNDPDQKVREAFFEILGTETPDERDIRRNQIAIFEILEDVLTETYLKGVEEDEFFMQFAEVRNLALGDKQEFYIKDNGVVIVSEHAGNNWNIDRQKMEGGARFTVDTKSYSAAIYGDFFLFLTGRKSFGELVEGVGKGIQNKINSEVAASFTDAGAKLPAAFRGTGSYDPATLQNLVSHVEAVAGSAMVVGTRNALSKITAGANFASFTEGMKADYHNNGRIYNYNGMTLVQLPAVHKANTFDFAYDDNKLLILPANETKPVKIVFEGKSLVKDIEEETAHMDMSFSYGFLTKFGTNVVFDNLFAIYELNN